MRQRVPADLHVQSCDELRALQPFIDERSHHRQEQRHEQRRRASLAGHIAERQQHATIGQAE